MRAFICIFVAAFLLFPAVLRADMYRYKDDRGNVHVTDSFEDVPPEYRSDADVLMRVSRTGVDPETGEERNLFVRKKTKKELAVIWIKDTFEELKAAASVKVAQFFDNILYVLGVAAGFTFLVFMITHFTIKQKGVRFMLSASIVMAFYMVLGALYIQHSRNGGGMLEDLKQMQQNAPVQADGAGGGGVPVVDELRKLQELKGRHTREVNQLTNETR